MNTPHVPIQAPSLAQIAAVLAQHDPDTTASGRAGVHASVAMLLRDADGHAPPEVLFIKRAERGDDPWSGHMAFPGGRRQAEDPSLFDAAVRETEEEVGLSLDRGLQLGRLSDLGEGRIKQFDMSVSCFVFRTPQPADLTLNHEVDDTVWIPLDYLSDLRNIEPYRFPPDPLQRDFPSFHYDGYRVWGLTYRLMADFLTLFGVTLPLEESGKILE